MTTFEKFSLSLNKLIAKNCTSLAIAVSGGPDSLCLTLLTNHWAQCQQIPFIALTVDHQLRPESRTEALQVHNWLTERGIRHEILPWSHGKITTHLQETARIARYRLLENYCRVHTIPYLLLGHILDDQFETIILRLAHHSSPNGLAGISSIREDRNVKIIRPLLSFSRQEIIKILEDQAMPWIEDPSNELDIYTRIRIRQNRHELKKFGLTPQRVLSFQQKMAQERMLKEKHTKEILNTHGKIFPEGYVLLPIQAFLDQDPETQEQLLSSLLKLVSGNTYPTRQSKLESLHQKLLQADFKAAVCHGCFVQRWKGQLLFCREFQNIGPPLSLKEDKTLHWDNRFEVTIPENLFAHNLKITALGDAWQDFKDHPRIQNLPFAVRRTLPIIIQKEQLISIPHLDYYKGLEELSECRLFFYPTIDLCRLHFIFS